VKFDCTNCNTKPNWLTFNNDGGPNNTFLQLNPAIKDAPYSTWLFMMISDGVNFIP